MNNSYFGELGTATLTEEDGVYFVEVVLYEGSSITNDFSSLLSAENWIYQNIND